MIEVSGVTKAYARTVVVDDVTISLQPGGITSIVGANGAGKSTLLSMIARLVGMDDGHISVGGLDVSSADPRELARTLGILKQENSMPLRLTVHDLVSFGRYPHSRGRLGPDDHAIVDTSIHTMDLDELRDRFLDEMSGGQRQRAFVAMLLAQDTDYLLLDEPLNNLDMAHALAMLERLRHAADALGKTVVMVVHDINFASAWSDHLVAMKDGRVVAQGSPREVVDSAMLNHVFGVNCAVSVEGGCPIAQYYMPAARRTELVRAELAHAEQSRTDAL
ncbi:iron ABC transporter ATP-binding protein [Aestuariimicrobium ganziense]|uniref:iron ABC transporter ATP-binding protein n=1 Tax=Aestuariimicrobium ganziense TaxID=2773677 RepID=UPI0019428665|nr:ATP-binding cassette domain-containing protein [Aestuariimicrobium ganziense]